MKSNIVIHNMMANMMQVNFLTKLVALKPGRAVQEMIKSVMQGKDEGAETADSDEEHTINGRISGGIKGRVSSVNKYCYRL